MIFFHVEKLIINHIKPLGYLIGGSHSWIELFKDSFNICNMLALLRKNQSEYFPKKTYSIFEYSSLKLIHLLVNVSTLVVDSILDLALALDRFFVFIIILTNNLLKLESFQTVKLFVLWLGSMVVSERS
jgi:hypothetical protein